MTKEALKLALEALEADPAEMVEDENGHMVFRRIQAIITLREALVNEALEKMAENARELGLDYEPEQEPVAVVRWNDIGHISWRTHVRLSDDTPLYTTPPPVAEPHKRTWVDATTWRGLTDDEIVLIVADCASSHQHTDIHFARAIEAKLKERNS